MAFNKIVIAGATGFLGRKVLAHLLTIPTISHITILSRSSLPEHNTALPSTSVTTIPSFEDHEALTEALRGHDILISTVSGAVSATIDSLLVSAAVAAGVKRFMPSEYTLDILHPHSVAVAGSTVLAAKISTAKDIEQRAQNRQIEYTTLVTGALLDWWFKHDHPVIDTKNRSTIILDGGDIKITGVSCDFIALCVGFIVTEPPEMTKNKRIRVAEVEYCGKELLRVFEKVTGENWTVVEKTTDELLKKGLEDGEAGNLRGLYVGTILKLNFDGKGAAFFDEGFRHGATLHRQTLEEIFRKSLAA